MLRLPLLAAALLAAAPLDRLTHHVTILEMDGNSYRLGQSRTRAARTTA